MHLVTLVMARNCMPWDPGNGQNPLTKIWVPYALTDPVLFLATLNFAAVHLDILYGRYSSPITLFHKGETIRQINARLQDPSKALTNTTIGAVAMLAAMEVSFFSSFHEVTAQLTLFVLELERELRRTTGSYGRPDQNGGYERRPSRTRMGGSPPYVHIMVSSHKDSI